MRTKYLLVILTILLFSLSASSQCRNRDSLALVDFYNATSGPNWTNTWNLNTPIDTWYGVTLNASGCLTCLDLDNNPNCSGTGPGTGNGLVGNLPASIGDWEDLETLVIRSDYGLDGDLPIELFTLENLEYLWISNTNIGGQIPADIINLTSLNKLYLQTNNLQGTIPTEIGMMTGLSVLYLGSNELTGTIPVELGNLTNLTNFVIHFNDLTGDLPESLGYLPSVNEFRVRGNDLSGCFPWSYTVLCNRPLGYNFTFNQNVGLPGGGDWASFCASQTGICAATCSDNFQNGSETDVDCGGSCPMCPDCNDGIQNGGETGVDCGGPDCIACNAHPLESWLYSHTQVGDAIKWNVDKTSNDIRDYYNWDAALKAQLHTLYDELLIGNYPSFMDPIPNQNSDTDNYCTTVLSDADAQHIYLSFVATSLYHEINNVFSWSILGYSEQSLNVLFDWEEYFYVGSNGATGFVNKFIVGITSTPSPPAYLKTEFMDEFSIVDNTEKATYANLLKFARDSMRHYTSGCHNHWQYYGVPPMSRVIDGTTRTIGGDFNHWAMGCHGTVSFTKWLGFWLNIPVIDDYVGVGHRIAILPSMDSLFITHGDDPYNGGSREPYIEQHHYLVEKDHFEDFFGTGDYSVDLNSNVGRRVNEIAFDQLPKSYLNAYCNDYLNNGLTEEDNYLANNYAGLVNTFEIDFMDSIHLWDKIHLKLKNDPNYNYCFSGYVDPIDYQAQAIQWEYLDNAVENGDSSLYKVNLPTDMKGASSTCMGDGDWAEMVVYNSNPETWFGLSNNNPALSLNEMDYAIKIQNNQIQVYNSGTLLANIEDDFKTSVKWLKISLKNGQVKFSLNGIVKHQFPNPIPSQSFNIYFGGEDQEAEINNIYSSTGNQLGCCTNNYTNNANPILNNIYKADQVINSQGVVPVNGDVKFKSGGNVNLNLGFESKAGAKFEVKIGPCN